MSEGAFTTTISTTGLAPEQRQGLDAQLRSEGIVATWLGETIQVDQAFEARVEGLVATARAAAPAPYPAGPGAPAPGYPAQPAPGYPAPAYPAYGVPPAYGYPMTPAPITNSNATMALVFAIIGWVACPILAIFGVIYGRRAQEEIAASGGTQGGEGLAKAGLIISWILIGIYGFMIVGVIVFAIVAIIAGAASA